MNKLEIYKSDNYILNDAFDQSVMSLHILRKQNGYKSFVICGCEAGDGATTVAINLAAGLASSGWRTVLIDGDMRKKNRYKRLLTRSYMRPPQRIFFTFHVENLSIIR